MKSGILPWFLIAAVVAIGAIASLVSGNAPQEAGPRQISYFRIATASPSGTYYPIGQLLAALISGPAESYCGEGGPCGVPGVVGLAEVSEGSVANLRAVNAGRIESGLAQGDLV
ncbi:MAG TPA: immunogenic protein, partial [Alphaproteobacteria bacterium]|nr:immunogenic protein [Alphaproteobacteria bacterium]HBA43425.1 immunogenic protein [Alphaproteobacteria bacterium]